MVPASSGSTDVIDDGRAERPRRRWPFVVLAAVVALALTAGWLDQARKHAEVHDLVSKTVQAQQTIEGARKVVLSTRQYTMPLLVSSSSVTVRLGLQRLIDQSAARELTQLRDARDSIADASILPWHHDVRDAKRANLAYLDQSIADFEQVAHGADLALLTSPAATTAATMARHALRSTEPSWQDIRRLTDIFKP